MTDGMSCTALAINNVWCPNIERDSDGKMISFKYTIGCTDCPWWYRYNENKYKE